MRILMILIIILSLMGCERSNMSNVDLSVLKAIPQQNWDSLSQKKIFFGHQSVGSNILNGIASITSEIPNIQLNIKETKDPNDFSIPIFAHSKVGKNMDPISKCDDFKRIMKNGIGDKVDIAFFKFCYVDIDSHTDIQLLFKYYSQTLSQLQNDYPKVKFIHTTVPLKSNSAGFKTAIKKLLDRPMDNGNIKRNQYNQLVREAYGQQNTIFDLAYYESAYQDVKMNQSSVLLPEYTSDGGHLNDIGSRIIGKQLLLFLLSNGSSNN